MEAIDAADESLDRVHGMLGRLTEQEREQEQEREREHDGPYGPHDAVRGPVGFEAGRA